MLSRLEQMTVNELYRLYECWPLRHEKRSAEGREPLTFYYEARIVRELLNRTAGDRSEQLKIEHCTRSYAKELENLSFLFSKPVSVDDERFNPDRNAAQSPAELLAFIRLYSSYRDIAERERLVEYVDMALDTIKSTDDKTAVLALATEVAEITRKKILTSPAWVVDLIEETLISVSDTDKVLPLLTLAMIRSDWSLQRKAQRIINRCYKACQTAPTVECLYIAVTGCDYVTRFSIRKIASAWHTLCQHQFSPETTNPDTAQLIRLLEVSDQLAPYADISHEARALLIERINEQARQGNLLAQICLKLRESENSELFEAV